MLINLSSFLLKTIQSIPWKEIKYHSLCLDCTWYPYQYLLPCLLYSVWVIWLAHQPLRGHLTALLCLSRTFSQWLHLLIYLGFCLNPSLPYWCLLTVYPKDSFSLHLHHDLISWCFYFVFVHLVLPHMYLLPYWLSTTVSISWSWGFFLPVHHTIPRLNNLCNIKGAQ